MPGLDGMGVVRKLREKGADVPHIIFVTAHEQYAVEAFRLQAMDYLLKPVDKNRLAETIERAKRALQESRIPEPAVEVQSQSGGKGTATARSKLLVRA